MDQNEKKLSADSQQVALDDERRVKVLSPGALVAKRFFRNRLAMVGLIILVAMFLFSFVGGLISPYGESQVFEGYDMLLQDYASVTQSTDYRFTEIEEGTLSSSAKTQFLLAASKNESTFEADGTTYSLIKEGEKTYTVGIGQPVVEVATLLGKYTYTDKAGVLNDQLKADFEAALAEDRQSFTSGGTEYMIQSAAKFHTICQVEPVALATRYMMEAASEDFAISYDFRLEALRAMENGEPSFELDGTTYTLEGKEGEAEVMTGGETVAYISSYVIQPVENGVTIDQELKAMILEAVENGQTEFVYTTADGDQEFKVERKDTQFSIRKESLTKLIKVYEYPSMEHWLGTDANGMDILTRLMYGGRISLLIGFVVILIEVVIGVVLGGLAGYFGKWVDNLIMRTVDVFNCIPTWPILIIIGSIMDAQRIDPTARIYMMMLVLGILGWPGVARMVRGQILSLREQEFMVAAEATGLSVSRRIFRHLVPNVIPQLIVICTMGLGSIILTESTMSFLGLGVKFPYASWGNIIQSVSNVYVMTNYWFVWIPAGFMILITVLGFNFVGDGLRDAFDPKMKR